MTSTMTTTITSAMTRAELTDKLLGLKRENGWSWKHICTEIGGMSPVLITGAIHLAHRVPSSTRNSVGASRH